MRRFLVLFLLGVGSYFQNVSGSEPVFSDSLFVSQHFQQIMGRNHQKPAYDIYTRLDTSAFLPVIIQGIEMPLPVIRIVAVGDIMPGTDYPSASYLPFSCESLFNPVKSVIQDADVATGNLEGVFSSKDGNPKNCRNPETCFVFRMPDSYAACIKDAGFDILGVANNHVNDFGFVGRKNTARILDETGLAFAGFEDRKTVIYKTRGITVGFCAFAPHTGTVDFKDYDNAAAIVAALKKEVDLVIVHFHAGAEGNKFQRVTREDEVFLGHNRGNPWYFSRKVIDAGADLVVGHGPHVVRAIEFYRGKLIAYSLGNFCTYARFNLSGPNAYAPILEVKLNQAGEFISGKIHSFIQLGKGGPIPDPGQRAMKKIRDLTRLDFPEQKLMIDESGNILK